MKFSERYEEMGLHLLCEDSYLYTDQYSEIVYRKLLTDGNTGDPNLDNFKTPLLGIFTKNLMTSGPYEEKEFKFVGFVSDAYQFIGNDVLNNQIRNSISNINIPIFSENVYLNKTSTHMLAEIIIQNSTNIPTVGDVYPQVVIKNTYDGTGKADVAFGLYMHGSNNQKIGFGFRNKIASMKQIHISNSQTTMSDSIGHYVDSFNNNIVDMIDMNFNNQITEDDMLSTLDLVEAVGKKRRDLISKELASLSDQNITSWDLFLAITKFSTLEKNLNAKMLMEDVAERVLVLPGRMMEIVANQES